MSSEHFATWEEAVGWLRAHPNQRELLRACYYDRPLLGAAERFWESEEWNATRAVLPRPPGRVLDVGAGHGISSFALAKDGWDTVALEPDPSDTVGSRAIQGLAGEAQLPIKVIRGRGETLPFPNGSFNLVYARQALHHAADLERLCLELFRVLSPEGVFLATREHVISSHWQLAEFLERHPLHKLYGGENAFTLKQYKGALQHAGFSLIRIVRPFDSVINYAPFTKATLRDELNRYFARMVGGSALTAVFLSDLFFGYTLKLLSLMDRRPGRPFTFMAQKLRDVKCPSH